MRVRETREVTLIWDMGEEEQIQPYIDRCEQLGMKKTDEYLPDGPDNNQGYIIYKSHFLIDTYKDEEE